MRFLAGAISLSTLAALMACTQRAALDPAPPLATATSAHATELSPEEHCTIPNAPRALVLRASRYILPIGADRSREEEGAVSAEGPCTPEKFCRHVSPEKMAELLARVRAAMGVHHTDTHASPHYGARYVEAEFDGGKCSVGDSSQEPVTEHDNIIFYGAWDAIVNAYVPPDAGPP